jgi:mutator protein MutT
MHTPEFYSAVFGIIENQDWKILFSRRYNTGHLDGYLSLPAGHVEKWEKASEAILREFKEEIDISINEIQLVCSQQSINTKEWIIYLNFFFTIQSYTGKIKNLEEDKCSELVFRSLDELQWEKIVPYVLDALTRWKNGEIYSEIRW